ncbi:hypothetical protein KOR34_41430 [Posidoniimonas corsicana]|uniref:Uncharacterized protein n=1 Tax=Posidoniimonas corsicana TaxID=1938618 RepID=A0A5C5V303_9BACT|nr:hypothetical protein KOR34_41430 [Posidoniimonas corsicana]
MAGLRQPLAMRFSVRTLLVVTTVLAVAVALWPRPAPSPLGYEIGHPRMDISLELAGAPLVAHGTLFEAPVNKAQNRRVMAPPPLGNHVVVLVDDLTRSNRECAERIASHPGFGEARPSVHFLKLSGQASGEIRSFGGRWGWERSESVEGALTAVMVMDQLGFRVPKEIRQPMGLAGAPTTITFASGASLEVCYTNDWGIFYLREVAGPERLTRRLVVHPYDSHSRRHEEAIVHAHRTERDTQTPSD